MKFKFIVSPHEHEPGSVFKDAVCHGVYIEVGDDPTFEWFQEHELEGNGYTVLALIDSLCRSDLKDDLKKYKMEAEADNAWVYGRDKDAIDRLIKKFKEATKTEDGVKLLIKNASKKLLE